MRDERLQIGKVAGLVLGAAVLCAAPRVARATDILVNCDLGDTIADALDAIDNIGPSTISVQGTCHENVVLDGRDRLTIAGDATIVGVDNALPALNVAGSHEIILSGLTLTGGSAGLRVARGSEVRADGLHSTGNVAQGVAVVLSSVLIMSSSTLDANGAAGLRVDSSVAQLNGAMTVDGNSGNGIVGAAARIALNDGAGPNSISNNGGNGVGIADGTRGDLNGSTTIEGNGGGGVLAFHASTVNLIGATVTGNAGTGVDVQETSHGELISDSITSNGAGGLRVADNADVYIDGGVVVSDNTGIGVQVELDGQLSSLGGNIISNNTGDGVQVRRMALGHFFAPDTVTGNGGHSVTCDKWSLIVGDLTGIAKVKCSNIDAEIAPAPPTASTHRHAL